MTDFIIENGVIVGYKGNDTDIVIPAKIQIESSTDGNMAGNLTKGAIAAAALGLPIASMVVGASILDKAKRHINNTIKITSIGSKAFYNCLGITSITISEGIKSIGKSAFSGCTNLASVTLPNTLTSVENNAFLRCKSLKTVEFSDGFENIGDYAFRECTSLESVKIPKTVNYIGEHSFDGCNQLTIYSSKNTFAEAFAKLMHIPFNSGDMTHDTADDQHASDHFESSGSTDVFHHVFISYSSKELSIAEKTKKYLEDNDIPCWMAPESIQGGENYTAVIPEAINECSCMVLLLSEKSQASLWVPREVETAINEGKRVIPLRIDNSDITSQFKFMLNISQVINAIDNFDLGLHKLLDAIVGR